LTHLKERLEKAEGTVYVAVEALYSMDGDIAPLKDIVAITTLYGAHLIVDEAHSAGVFGPKGKGLVSALGLEDDIFLRLITFGKAFGSHGAVLLCSSDVKRYMINFCRPFIYSTALPAFIVEHNWSVVSDDSWQQKRKALEYVIRSFRDGYSGYSPSHPESPIQMVYFEGVDRVKSKVEDLQKSGIAVKAIFPPTVPEGKACIRLCMHAFNTEEEIDQLVQLLTA
jgi:8-amino-7-oxononanoate synthase